jgi:type VI secretion system protein ImpC
MAQRAHAKDLIKNFVEQILAPGTVVDKNVVRTINARINAIDEVLTKQVDRILHHPDFQKLEGSWRGLKQLVMSTETGETLKIKVFNVSKKDLQKDFGAAAEFTESALWKKIYEFEFGTYGGDPFGALMGDFEFDKGPMDVALLTSITEVAAASHALHLGVSPRCWHGQLRADA